MRAQRASRSPDLYKECVKEQLARELESGGGALVRTQGEDSRDKGQHSLGSNLFCSTSFQYNLLRKAPWLRSDFSRPCPYRRSHGHITLSGEVLRGNLLTRYFGRQPGLKKDGPPIEISIPTQPSSITHGPGVGNLNFYTCHYNVNGGSEDQWGLRKFSFYSSRNYFTQLVPTLIITKKY
ncbi:unnamed protein product [Nesidiocoris tenuis]|uniref:Uncharacterized protein n=1 Tax=Nesidiocoris tenuis TaxID=355587 RepID=A0A6H5HQ51_9HEMI|nr:unnamed protein product [Nesidiocoris tenuis]